MPQNILYIIQKGRNKMEIKLYHKAVFWEKRFNVEALEIMKSAERAKKFSKHLINDRLQKDKNRQFTLEDILTVLNNHGYIFEVETKNGKVTKTCTRFNFTDNEDLIVVCREGIIITAWTCRKHDIHNTLDTSKYATA